MRSSLLRLSLSSLALTFLLASCSSNDSDGEETGGSGASSNSGGAQSSGGSGGGATGLGGSGAGGFETGGSGAEDSGGSPSEGGTTSSGGEAAGGRAGGSIGGTEAGGSGGESASGGQEGSGGNEMGDDLRTFVYVGSGDWSSPDGGLVTVYEIDRTTQRLSFISEHAAGGLPSFLAIDEERRRLFVADESKGGVISYSINESTGELTHLGATASDNAPVYVSTSPDGAYLLAANYNQGNVDVYPIGSDGLAQSSAQTVSTGEQAHCVIIDENERVLVANKGAGTISHFDFSGGTLTEAAPSSTALTQARHLFDGSDGRIYVVSEEANLITAFDRASDGTLTQAWQEPRLPEDSVPEVDTGADIALTPSGKFLYATNRGNSNTLAAYDLQGDAPLLIEHEDSQGTTPRNFAIDPLEEFLIVANHGSEMTVATFNIEADGSLEHSETLEMTSPPYFVGIARF